MRLEDTAANPAYVCADVSGTATNMQPAACPALAPACGPRMRRCVRVGEWCRKEELYVE